MGTSPEYEYLNLKRMYEMTSRMLADSDTDEKEKAENLTIMENDLFHAALEAGEKDEAEKWIESVFARVEQVKAWAAEDPEADLDWWFIIARGMVEELDALEGL